MYIQNVPVCTGTTRTCRDCPRQFQSILTTLELAVLTETFHPSSHSAYWFTPLFQLPRVLIDGLVAERDPRCTSRLPSNFQEIDYDVGTPAFARTGLFLPRTGRIHVRIVLVLGPTSISFEHVSCVRDLVVLRTPRRTAAAYNFQRHTAKPQSFIKLCSTNPTEDPFTTPYHSESRCSQRRLSTESCCRVSHSA